MTQISQQNGSHKGYVTVLVGAGLATIVASVAFAGVYEGPMSTAAMLVLGPLVVGAALLVAGVTFRVGGIIRSRDTLYVLGWTIVGVVAQFVINAWIVAMDGIGILDQMPVPYVFLVTGASGAVLGAVVGVYQYQNQRFRTELAQEREQLGVFSALTRREVVEEIGDIRSVLGQHRQQCDGDDDAVMQLERSARDSESFVGRTDALLEASSGERASETPGSLGEAIQSAGKELSVRRPGSISVDVPEDGTAPVESGTLSAVCEGLLAAAAAVADDEATPSASVEGSTVSVSVPAAADSLDSRQLAMDGTPDDLDRATYWLVLVERAIRPYGGTLEISDGGDHATVRASFPSTADRAETIDEALETDRLGTTIAWVGGVVPRPNNVLGGVGALVVLASIVFAAVRTTVGDVGVNVGIAVAYPIILGGILLYAGSQVDQTADGTSGTAVIFGWIVVGVIVNWAASVWFQIADGIGLGGADVVYSLLLVVAVGLASGSLIGVYDLRRHATDRLLESERSQVETIHRTLQRSLEENVEATLGAIDRHEGSCDNPELLTRLRSRANHVRSLADRIDVALDLVVRDEGVTLDFQDLTDVLEAEADQIRDAHGAAIDLDISERVMVAAGEPLDLIFENVLSSLIQDGDEGSEIDVAVDPDEETVTVRITGNGSDGPRIDDVDEEIDVDSTADFGFYLAHRLVEEYNGDLWVEDDDPRGTVFNVRLNRI